MTFVGVMVSIANFVMIGCLLSCLGRLGQILKVFSRLVFERVRFVLILMHSKVFVGLGLS